MRSKKLRTALLAASLFIAGWTAGQFIGGTAQAQVDAPITDPNIVALMMGVASVAVDTEAERHAHQWAHGPIGGPGTPRGAARDPAQEVNTLSSVTPRI